MGILQSQIPLWLTLLLIAVVLIAVFIALAFGYRMGQGRPLVNSVPQMVKSLTGGKLIPDTDSIEDEIMTLEDVKQELRGIKTYSTTKEG